MSEPTEADMAKAREIVEHGNPAWRATDIAQALAEARAEGEAGANARLGASLQREDALCRLVDGQDQLIKHYKQSVEGKLADARAEEREACAAMLEEYAPEYLAEARGYRSEGMTDYAERREYVANALSAFALVIRTGGKP